jgi:EAL domain-containing protein (putative c-di-GMP-specific phosphodiesterase class I)
LDSAVESGAVKMEVHDLLQVAAAIVPAEAAYLFVLEADRLCNEAQTGTVEFELSRESPFFLCTLASEGCFIVPNTLNDARFAADPFVSGGPHIRFFAGMGLRSKSGNCLGILCLLNSQLRQPTAEQCHALDFLGKRLAEHIELRGMALGGHRSDTTRQRMLKELRNASEHGDFELHYQPKVDLRTNRMTGIEALLRWDSEAFGPISPASFVPLLEESGLILPVGAWVIEQAVADYQFWINQGFNVPSIAVNVSPAQLADSDFVNVLERALRNGGGLRAPIDIEITEGMLLAKTGSIIRKLNTIRNMGIQIAIDDFGTGYSSLRYLAHLPIDTLKIDRSFVSMMADEADNMSIVSSVIALAHGLDLDVVAEGVETAEQRKLLGLLRCDQMQGYLYSPAVCKDRIADLMRVESDAATHRNPILSTADELGIGLPERRRTRTRR